jgi:hypothetical protein
MLHPPLNEIIKAEEKSNPRFKGPWLLSCVLSMSEKMLIVGAFLYYCGGGRLLVWLKTTANICIIDQTRKNKFEVYPFYQSMAAPVPLPPGSSVPPPQLV